MKFEWDPAKEEENRRKHGISFGQVTELFMSGRDYLEVIDESHSEDEDRFLAVGPIESGIVVVVFTEPSEQMIRIVSARPATTAETRLYHQEMGGLK